jgi:hypothetical protein
MSLNRRALLVPLSGLFGFMLAFIMGVTPLLFMGLTPFSKAEPAPANQPQIGRYQHVVDKTGGLMLLETSTGKMWYAANTNRADVSMEWKLNIDAPPAK